MAFTRYEKCKNSKRTGNPFDGFKKVTYYDYQEIDKLIEKLLEEGYDCIQLSEGILGSGNWICIPADSGNYYHFIIKEVYINQWQSGHTVRKCRKLSKADKALLESME